MFTLCGRTQATFRGWHCSVGRCDQSLASLSSSWGDTVPRPVLIGNYTPPAVRKGDRVTCLYRDADCIVTGIHDGRIPWPRVRALERRGGSGLLVNADLQRAIQTESAAALMYWFGVGTKAVWRWRATFVAGPGKFRTTGSKIAHDRASRAGAEAMKAKEWTDEERDARAEMAKRLGLRPRPSRPGGRPWTAKELRLLGTAPDSVVAERLGRTTDAVRVMRTRCGRPTAEDRRRSK